MNVRESRLAEVEQALQAFQWHRGLDTDAVRVVSVLAELREASVEVVRAVVVSDRDKQILRGGRISLVPSIIGELDMKVPKKFKAFSIPSEPLWRANNPTGVRWCATSYHLVLLIQSPLRDIFGRTNLTTSETCRRLGFELFPGVCVRTHGPPHWHA